MSDYSNNLSNELLSFKKSITLSNRQTIEKYLSFIKNLSEEFLNQALFWCIDSYKVEEQTDECLHVLLRHNSEISKCKANPNCEINFETPLIAACRKGQLCLVKRLIENGAKADLTNSKNKHALQFILESRQQNYDVAEYLINQMQSVNFTIQNKHPIMISVEKEFYRIFKSLLDKGSDLVFEQQNILHFTMKHKFKNIKIKKKFLKQLATKHNLIQPDKYQKFPIHYADTQEIKTFYLDNFKAKKHHEPTNQLDKSLNASIFINTKINKKQSKLTLKNEKSKILYEMNSFLINKPMKQSIKQTRNQAKQAKQEEASFEDEVEDKSEDEVQEEDKFPEKALKNFQPTAAIGKKPAPANKLTHNAAFVLNSSNVNLTKESVLSNFGPANLTKPKTKYNVNGFKPQINTKSIVTAKKYEPKRSTAVNAATNQPKDSQNVKKKSPPGEDKKQTGSNKKTNYDKMKIKEQIKLSKEYNEDKSLGNNEDIDEQDDKEKQSQLLIEQNKQLNQIINDHFQLEVDTLQIQNQSESILMPKKYEPITKSPWQSALETCDKLMEQFIIKDEHQITNLKELKAKFNSIFYQYQQISIQVKHPEEENSSELRKQLDIQIKVKLSSNTQHDTSKQLKPFKNKDACNSNSGSIEQISQKEAKSLSCDSKMVTEQILSIESASTYSAQKKTQSIRRAIQFISTKILMALQSVRKEKIQLSIQIYGSRANGLQIQSSDTDLLIICNINASVHDLMAQLERSGVFKCNEINEVKFLTNTSMPIMKLSLSQQFMLMNIDLTFQIRGHTGLRCTLLIRQFIQAEQLLKPLVVSLKTLLNCYDLCDTYTGGLGSYSLTLMTIALLQFTEIKKDKQNLGEIFEEFLLFYGFQMDYICQAIIIHPPGFNERPAFSIYQLPYSLDLTPKLIIYDPLNPVNNVGRATYRITQLKKLFKIWYVKLRTELRGHKDSLQQLMKIKNELLSKINFASNQ